MRHQILGVLAMGAFVGAPVWAGGECDRLSGQEKALCLKEQGLAALPKMDVEKMEIVPTGVQAIDDVFAPVDAILTELRTAKTQLADSKTAISKALGKRPCETMGAAAGRFALQSKGTLSVTVQTVSVPLVSDEKLAKIKAKFERRGKPVPPAVLASLPKLPVPMPQLEVAGGGGSERSLVAAVNLALEGTTSVVKTAASIPTRMQGTVATATLLPAKAPKAIKKIGLNKEDAAEVLQIMQDNLLVVLAIPKLAFSTMSELKDLFAAVQSVAGGEAGLLPGPREVRGKNGHIYTRYSDDYIRVQMGSKHRCLRPKPESDSTYQETVRAMADGESMDLDSEISSRPSNSDALEAERAQKEKEAKVQKNRKAEAKKKRKSGGSGSKKVMVVGGLGLFGTGGYMLYDGYSSREALKTQSNDLSASAPSAEVNAFREKEQQATQKMVLGGVLMAAGSGAMVSTLLSTGPNGPGMMVYLSGPW